MLCCSASSLGVPNDETLIAGVKVLASLENWVQGLFLENDWGLEVKEQQMALANA
jgi:hypothetical protein